MLPHPHRLLASCCATTTSPSPSYSARPFQMTHASTVPRNIPSVSPLSALTCASRHSLRPHTLAHPAPAHGTPSLTATPRPQTPHEDTDPLSPTSGPAADSRPLGPIAAAPPPSKHRNPHSPTHTPTTLCSQSSPTPQPPPTHCNSPGAPSQSYLAPSPHTHPRCRQASHPASTAHLAP